MDCTASFLPYEKTGYFSKTVVDYVKREPSIRSFYAHPVSLSGIKKSIDERKKFSTNRSLLVDVLQRQYASVKTGSQVVRNINLLKNDNTFTICTAHQPNIFTGPLYFIYKILHAAKLAEELKREIPENDFVPVYYMGSEDADLDELGHFYIEGEKYTWKTNQTGAVGRMKVDKALLSLLDSVSGRLLVHPHGAEIIELMKDCYREGVSIEQATFQLVNGLFADYGVVVLLPDNADLKASFMPVIERELTEAFSHTAVQETIVKFPEDYKVQASGRELNMFYLIDDKRERLELKEDEWWVVNTEVKFNREQLHAELKEHPERFSPNVILRPVFQEWVLPNIAFIGGGGEIAYWLQLKGVFEAVKASYPVLIVRNSFMFISKESQAIISKLKFDYAVLFHREHELMNELVKRESALQLSLQNEQQRLAEFYEQLGSTAGRVDITLQRHTAALQTQALKKIVALEKKMLRSEKKKYEAEQRKLQKIKLQLFPGNGLQERVDNLMPYYADWGKEFLQMIYGHSKGLAQEFGILVEKMDNNF